MGKLETVVDRLNEKGYIAELCETGAQAKERVLELIGDAKSVGTGGSITLQEIGVIDAVGESGRDFYCLQWAAKHTPEADTMEICRNSLFTDVFLSSTNALTEDGVFINIDGRCNRVAGLCFGPRKVVMVVGRNKLCATLAEANARVKAEACPKNAQRLKKTKTPCITTGKCNEKECLDMNERMCKVTMRMDYPPTGREMHIILVNEDLGY